MQVCRAVGCRFLGYSFWGTARSEVKPKLSAKTMGTFRQRVRKLT